MVAQLLAPQNNTFGNRNPFCSRPRISLFSSARQRRTLITVRRLPVAESRILEHCHLPSGAHKNAVNETHHERERTEAVSRDSSKYWFAWPQAPASLLPCNQRSMGQSLGSALRMRRCRRATPRQIALRYIAALKRLGARDAIAAIEHTNAIAVAHTRHAHRLTTSCRRATSARSEELLVRRASSSTASGSSASARTTWPSPAKAWH